MESKPSDKQITALMNLADKVAAYEKAHDASTGSAAHIRLVRAARAEMFEALASVQKSKN